MGIFTNIESALNTRLSELNDLPRVAWPNMHFVPTENEVFIRPTILPFSTSLSTLAGVEVHKGMYQIDVYVPLEKGISVLTSILDNIQDLFKSERTLTATDVVLIQEISRGMFKREESWFCGMIEIRYICYS